MSAVNPGTDADVFEQFIEQLHELRTRTAAECMMHDVTLMG